MRVWILQTGEPLHIDNDGSRPMRAINLSNKLVERGHQVTLWSSKYNHQKKIQRSDKYKNININDNLKIILISSTGYKKNVSLARLIDHFFLAINLQKKLNKIEALPDVVFIGYPPIESAYVMTKWLKKNNIPSMLDVKDQWPIVLVRSTPKLLRPIASILSFPYFLMAKKSMNYTNSISAMSNGFLDWARKFSNTSPNEFDKVVYLTSPPTILTDMESTSAVEWWAKRGVIKNDKFRIMFVGSFSRAFDFDQIFESAKELSLKNIDCEFVLCGDGELYKKLEEKALNYFNIKVIGWIDQSKIMELSKVSSLFIAPYKNSDDFVISIPNKVIDSMRLALPIICPLKGEVKKLINNNNIGFYYNNSSSLVSSINILINDNNIQQQMSKNAENLYNSKFSFNNVYDDLVSHLENMAKK